MHNTDHFEGFEQMLERVQDDSLPRWTDSPYDRERDVAHYGTRTWAEAIELARHGWPAGRAKMKRGLDAAREIMAQDAAPAWSLDVAGAFPHIPAAVAGDPENMWDARQDDTQRRPIIRLLLNRGAMARVPSERIINYGIAVLAVIDQYESAGYQVELTTAAHAESRRYSHTSSVIIKQAQEPLDLDRAAFVLGNPAMHRRLTFLLRAQHPDAPMAGMGRTKQIPHSVREPDQIYLSGANFAGRNADDLSSAIKLVQEQLRTQLDNPE